MSLLKIILGSIVALAIGFIVVGLFLPREVYVARDTVIKAPPEAVFAYLNSPKKFNEWSPWAKRDPKTEYLFTGPDKGVGAKMAWKSNNKEVGTGTQEIVASMPGKKVRVKLDFGDMGNGYAAYTLTPEQGGTKIVWDFETDLGGNIIAKYFGLMFDKWIGTDYEAGLASLKTLVEKQSGG